jgi:hypothetical protein
MTIIVQTSPAKRSVVVLGPAAQERVGGGDGVEGGLELAHQVAVDQAAQELPIRLGETGIPRRRRRRRSSSNSSPMLITTILPRPRLPTRSPPS